MKRVQANAKSKLRQVLEKEIVHSILLAPSKNKLSKIKKRIDKLFTSAKSFE